MKVSVKNWVSLHIGTDRQGSGECRGKGLGCQVMTVLNAIECPLDGDQGASQTLIYYVPVSHSCPH